MIEHLVVVTLVHAHMLETNTYYPREKDMKNNLIENKYSASQEANYSVNPDSLNEQLEENNVDKKIKTKHTSAFQ